MQIREHKNSNKTILVTLSTKKDCNNVSVNLLLEQEEYNQFQNIDKDKIDNTFIENLYSKFGHSVSINALRENYSQYSTVGA